MKIREVLLSKGTAIHSIEPTATLADVVRQLVAQNCGSLIVIDNGQLVGIITERDILRCSDSAERPLTQMKVADKMTKDVVTANSDDDLNSIMGVMTSNRIRHLPIVNGRDLVGVLSIGDVVKAQFDKLSMENEYLRNYIHG